MAYNFFEKKEYKIDWDGFYNDLMNARIFESPMYQKSYCEAWIGTLMKAEKIVMESVNNPAEKNKVLKELSEAPERFEYAINYPSNTINIYFRISRLIQMLRNQDPQGQLAETIKLSEIFDGDNYRWDKIEGVTEVKNDPIIVTNLFLGDSSKYVVLDGNHRLSYAQDHNLEEVKVFFIDPNALISNHLFVSLFDEYMYAMHMDFHLLSIIKTQNNATDLDLQQNSFLSKNALAIDALI